MSALDRGKPIKMLLSALALSRENRLTNRQSHFVQSLSQQRHDPDEKQIVTLGSIIRDARSRTPRPNGSLNQKAEAEQAERRTERRASRQLARQLDQHVRRLPPASGNDAGGGPQLRRT